MLSSSILLIALAAAGQDDKPWEVVTSREGNFTVEMPVKPNHSSSRTSRGPTGQVKVTEISCETPDGAYIVARVEDPVIIPKPAEEAYLIFTRDMYAAKFNGKVTSDKKIALDRSAGRDFSIRAQPDTRSGIVTIRAREYLQGKAVFILLAVSPPDRELTTDSAKFLGSFAFGIHPKGTTVKADRRETEATGTELAGWGMAIDPDGDCKIKPSGTKSLLLEIPGTLHDLVADIGKFNAPRILRDADADFVAIVRVDGTFPRPGGKSTKEKTVPLNAAGLVLWKDAENYIFIMKTAMARGGKINSAILFEEREAGHRGAMHNLALPAGAVFLRLERKGGRINGAVSGDGVNWKTLKPMDTTWAEGPVRVGLVATNTSSDPSTVRFENYTLKAR